MEGEARTDVQAGSGRVQSARIVRLSAVASVKFPQVRPEFGPTLPELIAPLPRRVRIALAAAAAVVALVVAGLLLTAGDDETEVVVREPVTFNLIYKAGLERVDDRPGAVLTLQGRKAGRVSDSYVVRPLRLPAYRGAPAGILPLYANDELVRLRRRYPGLELELEGRTRVNNAVGYQLLFRAKRDGRSLYVRHLLLVPEDQDGAREGVVVEIESTFASTPNLDAVGTYTPLKTPYRSFRFGTDREGGEA